MHYIKKSNELLTLVFNYYKNKINTCFNLIGLVDKQIVMDDLFVKFSYYV